MHRRRLVLACAVSAVVILWAPYVGQIRSLVRSLFPDHFVTIVGAALVILAAGLVVSAVARIRDRRTLRYGAIAAALAIAAVYSLWSRTGRPDADIVERFHFVEFGLVTFLFYRAARPLADVSMFVVPVLAALLVGTLEEWFQWFIPARVGEMRDIFLNGAAIASGLFFSCAVDPPPRPALRLAAGSPARLSACGAAVALVLAVFFHTVHLGYEIRDGEAGAFRSHYRADELLRLAAHRAAWWRIAPPPLEIPRLSREDQYMTEGVEHVMERNRLWGTGDLAGAWYENRILEKYYAPVIDTRSYHSKAGHRWPVPQREQAAAAAVVDRARRYVSRSNPAPIYTWSKLAYWSAIAAVIAVLAAAATFLDRRRFSGGARTRRSHSRQDREPVP